MKLFKFLFLFLLPFAFSNLLFSADEEVEEVVEVIPKKPLGNEFFIALISSE